MPGQGRLGDKANVTEDAHGCPGCPHPGLGPAIAGSADVFINGRPALRLDDVGLHAACCGLNQWSAARGSDSVFINGRPAHRIGDETRHCGGKGQLIEGSGDVIVGGSPTDAGHAAAGARDRPKAQVAFSLRDERGRPLAGRRYRVTASDGQVKEGTLDADGAAIVGGLAAGSCRVAFPDVTS
ncbi:MAG TPA: hypothetical protein VFF06_17660 [Polyangia bacterium]|nr:hypothetical protein [Polyangia bacterium]